MKRISTIFLIAAAAACTSTAGPVARRGDPPPEGGGTSIEYPVGSTGTTGFELPPDTSACACVPGKSECGAGLRCVSTSQGYRCLAPCAGPVPGTKGGYITTCPSGQCFYPDLDPVTGTKTPYCNACLSCQPPHPDSLLCQ